MKPFMTAQRHQTGLFPAGLLRQGRRPLTVFVPSGFFRMPLKYLGATAIAVAHQLAQGHSGF